MNAPSLEAPASSCRIPSAFGLSWPLLLGVLGFLLSINSSLLVDPDTYWHIATARWMVEHFAIPTADPFSHSMPGAPWVAHEWLAELLLGGGFAAFGWAGPAALAAFAFALAMALLCRYLLRHLEPIYAIGLSSLSMLMVQHHLLARPHALILPVLALWAISLVQAREEGRVPALPWVLVLGLWANLHGSFPLGLALAAFFGLEAILAAAPGERRPTLLAWGRFIFAAGLAVLLTPHGFKGLAFAAELSGMSYSLQNLGEWRSPNFQRFQPLEVGLMAAAAAVLLRGLRLPPMRILLLLGLLHLSLAHVRHGEILGLLAPLAVAQFLGSQWKRQSGGGQAQVLDKWFAVLAAPARPLAIAAAVAILAGITLLLAAGDTLRPPAHNTPVAALKAVRSAATEGAVLNDYHFGGYLIFSGIPPFIDGRADLYGDAFVADYRRAVKLETPDRFLEMLRQRNIGWTLLAPDIPAVALLDHLPGWRRLYGDEYAVVHVRIRHE